MIYKCDKCGAESPNIMAQVYIDDTAYELCNKCNIEYTKVWQAAERIMNNRLKEWLKK